MANKKLPKGVTQRADGVLEKKTPHFDLSQIKSLVAQHGAKCFTHKAQQGVQDMKLTIVEAVAALAAINATRCFYKSMTSYHDANLWQDVYRVPTPKGDAYVKFQLAQAPPGFSFLPKLVIQFKAK